MNLHLELLGWAAAILSAMTAYLTILRIVKRWLFRTTQWSMEDITVCALIWPSFLPLYGCLRLAIRISDWIYPPRS